MRTILTLGASLCLSSGLLLADERDAEIARLKAENEKLKMELATKNLKEWVKARGEGGLEAAKLGRTHADIENIKTQLQIYEVLNGTFPSSEQGLRALVERPANDPQPRRWRQLMPVVPLDAWGTPYVLRNPSAKGAKEGYDVFSCGPDKMPNTKDDIGNW